MSGTGRDFFSPGHSFGLSIIEALDTLYVMELDAELHDCVVWLRENLTFDVDAEVQMFEAIIRMVGGLLAGFYATQERFLLDAARDLADRLLACFTKSPSGVPYRYVNLRTGAVRENVTNLAEAGSNILELGELTRLTRQPKYVEAAKRSYRTLIARRSKIDLLPGTFDVEKGLFVDSTAVGPNPPADSFYEYLWGAWRLFEDAEALEWYRILRDAMLKYQLTHIDGRLWFSQVGAFDGIPTPQQHQSELAAFYAELLAKGGDVRIGDEYYDSWTAVARKYELIPEVIDCSNLAIVEPQYLLRPEYANSAFDLWFLTGKQKYRDTAYAHFLSFREHCRVENGYCVVTDVRPRPMKRGDLFPAYSFAENFKYLYLMFADSPRFDALHYHLSTEGKILRGLLRQKTAA